jgi:hypothetical protein
MASSKAISSTYAMGGVRDFLHRRVDAKASACSNFLCRWRRDSTVYQEAPLHGFPHALGMVETLGMTRVPSGWTTLLQSFDGALNLCFGGVYCECAGDVSTAMIKCFSMLSIPMISQRVAATALAIKAWCCVRWRLVQFPCARRLVAW